MRRSLLAALLVFGTGCATGIPAGARTELGHLRPLGFSSAPHTVPSADPVAAPEEQLQLHGGREDVVRLARSLLGKQTVKVDGHRYPDDCTGLVRALFDKVGMKVVSEAEPGDNAVTAIYRFARAHGRIYEGGHPVPGDLVFFRETYDLNRDGRLNDGLTHIGIVEDELPDGTVLVIHRVKRGVVRYRMNLAQKSVRKDPKTGAVLNDLLRAPGPGQREVLTGELFAAYATLLPLSPVASR